MKITMPIDTHCSFCGKKKSEVQKLISGPKSEICNECVDSFAKTFAKMNEGKPKLHCSFCLAENRELITKNGTSICSQCVDLCSDKLPKLDRIAKVVLAYRPEKKAKKKSAK
jgi:ATP-dependent protease Clp ATPase subunit